MSIPFRGGFIGWGLIVLSTFNLQLSIARAQAGSGLSQNQTNSVHAQRAIPFDQIGAVAGKQYSGEGLAVAATSDGATLHCAFQRLNAQVTTEGLWLTSTKEGAKGQPFRIIAHALGRTTTGTLPPTGTIKVEGQTVRFVRPGLTEEYSVGVDGLQQDFVIEQRPDGNGPLRLELGVDGAKAEPIPVGARLVLADGGRDMAYDRVKAVDARGKELSIKLEVLSADRLAMVLDDTAAHYPVRIDPTFSDANWTSFGGLAGVNGGVYATAADGSGNLYVGGRFTVAGNVFANNIAEWNGNSWLALGSGISGGAETFPPVAALAISGTNLFAAGIITTAGGVSVTNIAQWNGSSWSALGSGVSGGAHPYISALTVLGDTVFVGGSFTTAGGVLAANLAEWNGSSWSALGPGILYEGTTSAAIFALAVSGTNLFAGGSFTTAGDVAATNIAQWNGSSWSALGSGIGYVTTLAVSGTNLFAGGYFTSVGGVAATNLAEWNGSSWSSLGSGINGLVGALAVSGSNLFVGGSFTAAGGVAVTNIAEWNGSSWSALGSWVNGGVGALAVSGSNLFVGGSFTVAGGVAGTNIAEWNGNSWSALNSGISGSGSDGNGPYVEALIASGTSLFVGGDFSTAGGMLANNIAQWDGSSWSSLSSGMNGEVLTLVASGTNLFAGGEFTTAGGVSATNIAEWNGSSWSALGSGMLLDGLNTAVVHALAADGSNLFAGGWFSSADGVPAAFIAEWNGSSWLALGSGMNEQVNALAISGTNLFAGGQFSTAGGMPANCIAEWNGSSWSALGSGMGIPSPFQQLDIYALAVSGTNLFAGGSFTTAGGIAATNIAKWNGVSWSPVGSGILQNGYEDRVVTLAVSGGNLFAGGYFTIAGGVSATNIAEWNGSFWSALGSGMNSQVNALAVAGNRLFAGGYFTMAGTNISAYLAEANIAPPTIISQPSNISLPIGDTANFGVSATGSLGLDYQWHFNTNNLVIGGTNSGLAIGPAVANDDGYYQVVVSNLFGSATSDIASLTVLVEPNMAGISNNPSGGTTTLSMGSYPSSTNYLYATTNLASPQWQLIATNVAASDGLFQFVDPNTKGVPAKFYRLAGTPLNLLADPSFETQSGWTLFGGAQYSQDYAHSGSWSMQDAAADGAPGCYQQFPASPGMKFEMSGYGFTPATLTGGTAYGILQITYFDSNNNNLGTVETSSGNALSSQQINGNTPAGLWTFLNTGVATAPPNSAYVQAFTLFVGYSGTDEGVYFDDLSLVQLN